MNYIAYYSEGWHSFRKGDPMFKVSFLLPLIFLFPILFNSLLNRFPSLKKSTLILIGPVTLLSLSFFSFLKSEPLKWVLWEFKPLYIGLSLDILSGIIATTVLTIGLIVMQYSVRYLEDDPAKKKFMDNLGYTLSSVLFMLLAPNFLQLFLAWVLTSFFLHRLLIHFSDRPMAQKAARQKFWVSRLGDFFIILSGVLLFVTFESLDFEILFETLKDSRFLEENKFSINGASLLLVLGAMTKSAQFPFHYWLPNTMETPTPVSALMHAGIINAGGYLVIRMSPLLTQAPLSLSLLALVGSFTAFWGAVIMLTQTNIKKQLAYSTISQMGFMMLQCGLGAFPIAVTHIVGHAFYKAYSFLSAGTATDFGRLNRYYPKMNLTQNLGLSLLSAAICLILIFGGYTFLKNNTLESPGISVLLVILSLSASQILMSSKNRLRSLTYILSIITLYLSLTQVMTYLLQDQTPKLSTLGRVDHLTLIVCIGFFIALYFIQNNLERISQTRLGKRVYVKALNGGI